MVRLASPLRSVTAAALAAGFAVLATACSDMRPLDPRQPTRAAAADVSALAVGPSVVDPNLAVRTVVDNNLDSPVSFVFIGPNDMLVTEKVSGRVKRVVNGVVQGTVLDLPVNSASERGLLGIALDPQFPADPAVYLYWTESSTGADDGDLANVPLRGNRVDRFLLNGSTLTMARNRIKLRSYQADAGQPLRGNHNGGVVRA